MSTSRLRAVAALLLASFAAACGSGDGGGGPSYSDSVTTVEATDFADGAAGMATDLADNLNFGSPSFGASQAMYTRLLARPEVAAARAKMTHLHGFGATVPNWQGALHPAGMQLAEGCTFSGHGLYDFPYGDPVDMNENNVPDDAAIDIVCTMSEEGNGDTVYTYIQEQHVAVKEIDGSIYGMTFSSRIRERQQDNHGNFEQAELKQEGKIDLRSSTASTDQSMSIAFSGKFDDEAGGYGAGEQWGADFDADATIVEGDPLPDGDLSLHGRSYAYEEPEGRNLSFTISTPTALAYSAACAASDDNPPFTAGVLLGKLNGSSNQASFEVTFTGCGTYTVAVDNANDPATVAAR
jgi:hypothetical protein